MLAFAPLLLLAAAQVGRVLLLAGLPGSRPSPTRTDLVDGPAFSSGHVLCASVGWGLATVSLLALHSERSRARPGRVPALALLAATGAALLVGPTRVYLGAHWASDVVASWALGVLLVGALAAPVHAALAVEPVVAVPRCLISGLAWARRSAWAWSLPALAALLSVVPLLLERPAARMKDFLVYYGAGGGDRAEVYAFRTAYDMPFTYPPFAALLARPLDALPLGAAQTLWTGATLAAFVALARVGLAPVVLRLGLPLTVAALLVTTPARSHLRFGQVGVFLVLLVSLDLLRSRAGLGRGARGRDQAHPAV